MNPEQITARHRSKTAYVYIRQSTERQVLHNQESQRRQRALLHRATELGWPRGRVVLVDEDLGQSGAGSKQRTGFLKMLAEAALGEVGIILSLESSRLSRRSQDWHHLLDICAVTGTLIADADGLYDPNAFNDRLLLGLKGTMSEAELHVIKQRLAAAIRSKAERGEFQFRPPPGYEWDPTGRLVKVPDEQVQSTIEMIFLRFEQLGSVHQVHGALIEEGLLAPVLSGAGHSLRWTKPSYAYVLRMLRHPVYAGAYAFGRRQTEAILDENQMPVKRSREKEPSSWHALIQDHHEGYISWDTFQRNQRRIAANRNGEARPGAPREGGSLLQGLLLCGRCGRRMRINYSSKYRSLRYSCATRHRQEGGGVCQDFSGKPLEQRIEQLVLEALDPLGIEAMVEAARAHAEASESERGHWQKRVERAQYEVDLARRQYDAVDPANRLVARELERRFEKALAALKCTEEEARLRLEASERPLSAREEQRLQKYSEDLASLWRAGTTRPQDRKRIVRLLVRNVNVTDLKPEGKLSVELHWIGGEVARLELLRGRRGVNRHVADAELIELIRTLAEEFTDAQIARILSRKGIRTPKGLCFTANRVAVTRNNHGIAKAPEVQSTGSDVYSPHEAAEILGVHAVTVIRWAEEGLLKGTQMTDGAPWRIQVTDEDVRRLKASDAPEGWLTLKATALALGISQQGVLQRLNSGKLNGVRVRVGRRSGWRIQLPAEAYVDQPRLF